MNAGKPGGRTCSATFCALILKQNCSGGFWIWIKPRAPSPPRAPAGAALPGRRTRRDSSRRRGDAFTSRNRNETAGARANPLRAYCAAARPRLLQQPIGCRLLPRCPPSPGAMAAATSCRRAALGGLSVGAVSGRAMTRWRRFLLPGGGLPLVSARSAAAEPGPCCAVTVDVGGR